MSHNHSNVISTCTSHTMNMAVSHAVMSAARFIFALRFYFCGFIPEKTYT